MILIVSKQEKELLTRLRNLHPAAADQVPSYQTEVLDLKRKITDLEIQKSKIEENHAKEERELRHMIGLEKKRQAFEIEQSKREATVKIREENLAADTKRFEENLKFNTSRFESMEKSLTRILGQVLERLPNVNVELNQTPRTK